MGSCEHIECHLCRRIVDPLRRETRMFVTLYCPYCGTVLSDVAKDWNDFKQDVYNAQENQYLTMAFEADKTGDTFLRNQLLQWAEERRKAGEAESNEGRGSKS